MLWLVEITYNACRIFSIPSDDDRQDSLLYKRATDDEEGFGGCNQTDPHS